MKTEATTGQPRSGTAPFSKSVSRTTRWHHRERASLTPSWPFPRLIGRRYDPDVGLKCPSCGRWSDFRRAWCSSCSETLS